MHQLTSDRPLISFALFTYNQEAFIAEAVQGALSQTYKPLEIILSDDHSTDRTFEIMKDIVSQYEGPHAVIVRQNDHNLGLVPHINRVMELVQGELIVVAAGDDISLPHRTEKVHQAYRASNATALSIYSQVIQIDSTGNHIGLVDTYPEANDHRALKQGVIGSSHAWHRKLFDIFGPLDEKVISEDAAIPFRATLLGKIHAIPEVLVFYRYHQHNLWQVPRGIGFRAGIQWQQARHRQRANNQVGIWETRIRDLQVFEQRYPEKQELVNHLRTLVEKQLDEYYLEVKILDATGMKRLWLIFSALQAGISMRRLARWSLQYTLPYLYYGLRSVLDPMVKL